MNPTRLLSHALLFLFRVLCFPLRAGSTGEDNVDDSTPQFSPQVQIPPPTREQEESDGLHLGVCSSESTVGNRTERVLITRADIRATNAAIRLRRVPVGFYVAVKTENRTQRTSSKPASVSKDVV
ncbi:hypothetical protein OG21DRAFT_1510020 [Imleria badia]|nr:hypothetical protein OG21DRAFT_1510020 [Imleria badia]